MSLRIGDGETILFIGDSVTDAGHRGGSAPLGEGFVKIFSELQIIREPHKKIAVINKGIGGSRTDQLQARWHDDVIRYEPDWLSILVGGGDLITHVFQGMPWAPPKPTSPEEYEKNYDDLLCRTRALLPECRILLIDSFYMSIHRRAGREWPTDFSRVTLFDRPEMLTMLADYLAVVDRMARKYKTRHVKTHEVFQRMLKWHEAETFGLEPLHPGNTGNLAIAEAVYQALSR